MTAMNSTLISQDMGIKGVGSLKLYGGACVQYYSNRKLKTNDLDYKFIPKEKCDVNEQRKFIQKYILPYLSTSIIDVKDIIRNRVPAIQKTILSAITLNYIYTAFNQLKTYENFSFDYGKEGEHRDIIKVSLVLPRKIMVHLLDITFLDSGETIPTVSVDIDPIRIDIIQKEYLENRLKSYIKDCDSLIDIYQKTFRWELNINKKLTPQGQTILNENFKATYITSSPSFSLADSVIYVGCNKALRQLYGIENPAFIDDNYNAAYTRISYSRYTNS